MAHERMAAIFIGGIMIFSVLGFALMSMSRFGSPGEQQPEVPNVMEEYLTNDQVASILRSGRVLIRDVYTADCTGCAANDATLEIFINTFKGYVVLEKIMIEPDNYTVADGNGYVKFEMLSPTGEITDLRGVSLTQEKLTELFCETSAVQPKECLLREI